MDRLNVNILNMGIGLTRKSLLKEALSNVDYRLLRVQGGTSDHYYDDYGWDLLLPEIVVTDDGNYGVVK